jgi:hypothetical protein
LKNKKASDTNDHKESAAHSTPQAVTFQSYDRAIVTVFILVTKSCQ